MFNINTELNTYFNSINKSQLKNILEYSLAGGKCIRGFIVKHIMSQLSNEIKWQPIVAIELIHGISLIIDDLPCMDNDLERRGKPSTFVKFGERQSILISMYGISEAFKLIFDGLNNINNNNINNIEQLVNEWHTEIGQNLILGQMLDLKENIEELLDIKLTNNSENIMIYKTASLFSFAFILGALYSNINDIIDFKKMGYHFGIMFQIMDDFKDIETDNEFNNYVLKNGKNKSLTLYYESKNNLLDLLNKYNLYTNEFINLLEKIDSCIPN